jgi:hypothetical protein
LHEKDLNVNLKIPFFPIIASIGLFLALSFSGVRATGFAPSYQADKKISAKLRPSRPAIELNRFQKAHIKNLLQNIDHTSTRSIIDTLRLAVLQVQFADSLMGGQEGSRRPEVRDSTFFANELQHLTDYFLGASRNRLTITWELLPPLYTLPKGMGYYGLDEVEEFRAVEMAQSAIDLADDDINFAHYDAMVIIHAGSGQETDQLDDSREQLWSSFYDLGDIINAFPDSSVVGLVTDDSLSGDPFFVDSFLLLPANSSQDGLTIGSLGIWGFVTGSRLGLLPMFDSTPAGFEDSRGAGNFCLMAQGLFDALGFIPAFPCVFNRMLAGWVDPILVENDEHFRLRDINSPVAGDTACLRIPITEGEYFLVVNRVHDTNFDSLFTFVDFDSNLVPDNTDSLGGAEFDFFLTDVTNPEVIKPDPNFGGRPRRFVSTGSGIYIWHIDETVIREALEIGFLPNDFVSRKGVDLEEADGVQDLDGIEDLSFSFGSYWDSFRKGHNDRFAPDTNPSSLAYSGAGTGITIGDISRPGEYMECNVSFSMPYAEERVRWEAIGSGQPPTPVNLGGGDAVEVIVLADTGLVYAFNNDGSEYFDGDSNPLTIEPFLSAPGALWTGPPAIGNLDGDADPEIVATSTDGRVFAWNADGSEVLDGDSNPLTNGVLYEGRSFAAPPMLIDVGLPPLNEILVIETVNDSLFVRMIDGQGSPTSADPVGIQAQIAAAPAFANLADYTGIVVAWVDTVEGIYGLSFVPVFQFNVAGPSKMAKMQPASEPLWSVILGRIGVGDPGMIAASPPATGDLDGNGSDEIVVTLPDGRLAISEGRALGHGDDGSALQVFDLWGVNPSAPALGDVDGDGTLEIACWDEDYFYLFKHNGAFYTDWPRPISTLENLDLPPLRSERIRQSPLLGDIDGDSRIEILFPDPSGIVYAFRANGTVPGGFPRNVPNNLSATPSIFDLDGDGELSLIVSAAIASIEGRDGVADTLAVHPQMILSFQSLPGSQDSAGLFWALDRGNVKRLGRTTRLSPLAEGATLVETNSFMIYPNPVSSGEVRVRVTLNKRARVVVNIYNLEGEQAFSRSYSGNPAGVIQTPFDVSLDISALKSGVYFLRLQLEGEGESDAMVKSFAIRR